MTRRDWNSYMDGFDDGLAEAWCRIQMGYVFGKDGAWYTSDYKDNPDWKGVHDGKRTSVAPATWTE